MADFITMINTIRDNSSKLYQDRIPVVTDTNMKDVGLMLVSQDYEPQKNEFCNALVYKVAFKDVINRLWKNPLAVLKNNSQPFGGFKEIAHTNPVTGKEYDGSDVSDMLSQNKPDVKTAYFTRNRRMKYPVTISDDQLETAFTSRAEFGKLYESIINAMYSGDNMDEYLMMRKAISECITEGRVKTIGIDYAAKPADLIKGINTISRYFKYESTDYAGYNLINAAAIEAGTETPVVTWCPPEKQVLLIREDIDVETDIDVLAKAFNMDKTNFATRKVGIDTFDDPDVLCVLADESFFEFQDDRYKVKSFDNGSNLSTNYWLHHWETIQLNPLANAVAFKQSAAVAG